MSYTIKRGGKVLDEMVEHKNHEYGTEQEDRGLGT